MHKVFLNVSAFSTFSQSIIDTVPDYIIMSGVPTANTPIFIDGNRWEVRGVSWGELENDGYYHPRVMIT